MDNPVGAAFSRDFALWNDFYGFNGFNDLPFAACRLQFDESTI